jgi:aryl-alcohol dehydrogenase-like predicted oxidoreductase
MESEILPVLSELGIGVTAYGVLSRGLLTSSSTGGPGDFRAHLPRFTGENLLKNQELAAALRSIAAEHGTTPVRLAIAWVLAQGANIVPLVGSRRREQLRDALGALNLTLSSEDLRRLAEAVPASQVAGTRYDARQMNMLDSERAAKAAS